MFFWFYGRRHVCTEWPGTDDVIVTHGFVTVTYTQTDPPRVSTGPGAETDIYDCLVTNNVYVLITQLVIKTTINRKKYNQVDSAVARCLLSWSEN